MKIIKTITGFVLLFALYHSAEYMIVYQNSPSGFLLVQGLFFGAAWAVARWQFAKGFVVWGFARSHFLRRLGTGLLVGMAVYGLTFLLSLGFGIESVTRLPNVAAVLQMLPLFVFGNFLSSFSEDILTRGYVVAHLGKRVGAVSLAVISAAVYVLNHIYRLNDGWETYLYLFLLGILFIIPLIKTRQIWTTGGIHWAGNCMFYFTHEVIKTDSGSNPISPNIVLSFVLILAISVLLIHYKRTGKC